MDVIETASSFFKDKYSNVAAIGVFPDGKKQKLKLFKTKDGSICYYAPRKRKYGYFLSRLGIAEIYEYRSVAKKSEEQKWNSAMLKIYKRLVQSGLWGNIKDEISLSLEIGYQKIQEAYKAYSDYSHQGGYEEGERIRFQNVKAVEPRLILINQSGRESVNTNIIWHYNRVPTVKKMYFGKYHNDFYLKQIEEGLKNKTKTHVSHRAGYDVSYEYNPEQNKAWYSEEYRGCGNGHYYLALDATHALFYEND